MANILTPAWRTKCSDRPFFNVRNGVSLYMFLYLRATAFYYDESGAQRTGTRACSSYSLSIEKKDSSANVLVTTFSGITDNTGQCVNDGIFPDPSAVEYFLDSSFFDPGSSCGGTLKATITVNDGECANVNLNIYRAITLEPRVLYPIGGVATGAQTLENIKDFFLDFTEYS